MDKPPHDTLVPQRRGVEMACDSSRPRGPLPFADGTPAGAEVPRLGDRSAPCGHSPRPVGSSSSSLFLGGISRSIDGLSRPEPVLQRTSRPSNFPLDRQPSMNWKNAMAPAG